jgi:predicted metal-dependent hydrolase
MTAQLQLFESRDATPSWTVRVSRRARRLSVRVYPGGRVEVVVPPGASAITVQRFVGLHREWIDQRVSDLSADSNAPSDAQPLRIELSAIGRSYAVHYEDSPRVTARIEVSGNDLTVWRRPGDVDASTAALRDWLLDLAEHELGRALAHTAADADFSYRRLQVRCQRTRWGSCSASGTISLNVCVLFQPADVMRYLLIHELSHTRHMNHSRRFWGLVESLEPDYRRLDRELSRGWQYVPGWMFGR